VHIQAKYIIASGGGAIRPFPKDGGVEELHGDLTVGPRPKVWTGELDPAEGVRKCCKKNFPSIGKRTREGCDRDSEIRTVHSG